MIVQVGPLCATNQTPRAPPEASAMLSLSSCGMEGVAATSIRAEELHYMLEGCFSMTCLNKKAEDNGQTRENCDVA